MSWADACYRALETRDARFDGQFFTAVRTTGIYCRPICPALRPKRQNVVFYKSAAAAQEAGFRPCLRCRPELSPEAPAALGTSATIQRALRLIGEGALDETSVDDFATRLGIGERHLRRLFLEHVGASPLAVAQTRRLLFAKKLIDETSLSMTDIAIAAGFGSVRRFNDAFIATYGRSPRDLRRSGKAREGSGITLKLPYRPPYNWRSVIGFFGPRAIEGVECVADDCYRRTIEVDGKAGWFQVRRVDGQTHLEAQISIPGVGAINRIANRLRRMFDLQADTETIAAHLKRDAALAKHVDALPGLRLPGAWDPFELVVRAILGQQVSVKAASTLAGRLVSTFGRPFAPAEGLTHIFPGPETLARADLTKIGVVRARAQAISSLAAAIASGAVRLNELDTLTDIVECLCEQPGIGPWTAHYVAMRAFGEPDAFPTSDLGLRKAVTEDKQPISTTDLARMAEAWRPWRSYAAMVLWMEAQ
jgi:AraC family transcriptional regulator of adaptative response / DNA-3-methyladenine glycosylase II